MSEDKDSEKPEAAPAFEVECFEVSPDWRWLAIPTAAGLVGVLMLMNEIVVGLVVQLVMATSLGIGIVRRPKRHRAGTLRIIDQQIFVGAEQRASVDEIVGMSVVTTPQGRLVSLARDGRPPLEIILSNDTQVAELRTLIGLGMARAASRTYRAHVPLGFLLSIAAAVAGLMSAIFATMLINPNSLVLWGTVIPMLLIGGPLLFGRLQNVVATLGEEGVHIKRLIGSRLVKYNEITDINRLYGGIVILRTSKRAFRFEMPSQQDALAFIEDVRQRASMPTPDRDENVAAFLARGNQSNQDWLDAVRKQASPNAESYRNLQLDEDRLWAVLEDPNADPTARIGAAVALRAKGGGVRVADVDKRVRIAANTTAFPHVRVALEEIVDAPNDEELTRRVMRALGPTTTKK